MNLTFPASVIVGVFLFLFGTCAGSFLNVCIRRLPRQESLFFPNSYCPECGHPLKARENIPILAWLFLRGRCRYCAAPISGRYVIVETLTALVFLFIWIRCYQQAYSLNTLLVFLFLAGAVIAIAFIDAEHYIIPDEITYTGIGVAFLLAIIHPSHIFNADRTLEFVEPALLKKEILIWTTNHLSGENAIVTVRIVAVLDTLAGAALAGMLLWVFLELGKMLFGHQRNDSEKGTILEVSAYGFKLGENGTFTVWEDVFHRKRDVFIAHVTSIRRLVSTKDAIKEKFALTDEQEDYRLKIQGNTLWIEDESVPLENIEVLEAEVREWRIPREALGFGDVKFASMIGAFLGVDAVLFVLMLGALLGAVTGGVMYIFSLGRTSSVVPFGPFLAMAALVWIFLGPELFQWYAHFVGPSTQALSSM